jgi:hypothetical protein
LTRTNERNSNRERKEMRKNRGEKEKTEEERKMIMSDV